MPNLPYKTATWDTHRESSLCVFEFPLDEQEPTHFSVTRTYEGPLETFKPATLNTVDDVYNGGTLSATSEADDETLSFVAPHRLLTGDPVTVSNVTGMTGVTAGSLFVIRHSATAIKLATSRDNAIAGTVAAFSADGTCDVTKATAYMVSFGPLSPTDGGSVRYTRTFANLPAQWSEMESFAFIFPALTPGTSGSSDTVTSIAAGSLNQVVIGTALAGVAVNDTISASVRYVRGGITYTQGFCGKVLAVSAGVSVTVAGNLLGSVGSPSSVSGTIVETAPARALPESIVVSSRTVHDYAISSPASLATDLPLHQPFKPITTATGLTAETLSASTTPTATQYFSAVQDGSEIVAECYHGRYLGNIHVRKTRLVPAT